MKVYMYIWLRYYIFSKDLNNVPFTFDIMYASVIDSQYIPLENEGWSPGILLLISQMLQYDILNSLNQVCFNVYSGCANYVLYT